MAESTEGAVGRHRRDTYAPADSASNKGRHQGSTSWKRGLQEVVKGGPDGGDHPRFTLESLLEQHRAVLLWAFALPALVVFGTKYAFDDGDTAGQRLLSAGMAVAAALLIASFVLRYFPKVLHHEWWARSRTRRLAQGVLLWAWVISAVVGLLWCVFVLLTPY